MTTYRQTDASSNHPRNAKRVPLWLPYLQSVTTKRGGLYSFVFNGGEVETKLDDISTIMVYGDTDCELTPEILDAICRKGIPIVIHRRNMAQPVYILGGARPDRDDTLTAQLTKRQHSRVATHIARQLLEAKFQAMRYMVPPAELPLHADITRLRQIEASHAKRYWRMYFKQLEPLTGHPEWTRRPQMTPDEQEVEKGKKKNAVATALDANSKFVTGIILRWITYHHLSPYHAFLHTPTDYPALVYDLIEPYRGLIEQHLLVSWLKNQTPVEKLLPKGIEFTKAWLDTKTYVPLTRQITTQQELLHGVVLSLKYYLLGKQRKFHVPMPGPAKGGRPAKIDFLLYGRHAGRTDFWKQAKAMGDPASGDRPCPAEVS